MKSDRRNKQRFRTLATEQLEERWTPAQFGIPWPDSTHLTVSFAPDGTSTSGVPSRLIASMDEQLPRAVWQDAILQAAQTWSEVANINIGLRPDSGQAFGTPGANQRDQRFGDIRIGGYSMDPSALAEAIPPSSSITGSLAGDIFINTSIAWNASKLRAVALHEIGHALGLDHSTDPASVMFSHLNNNVTLASSDIVAIRALYGVRSIDLNEGTSGNNNIRNATRIRYSQVSGGYNGSTPLVAYGDIHRAGDVDFFSVKPLIGYSGNMTFRLQTTGISLLTPSITILDRNGVVLASKVSTTNDSDILNLRISNVVADQDYFVRVEGVSSAKTQVGRYALGVIFDGLVLPTVTPLDQVMRGPYETLAPEKVDQLFKNPLGLIIDDDLHANDTTLGAVKLNPGTSHPNARNLSIQSTLTDATDVDFFQAKSPTSASNRPWVTTISLNAWGPNATLPRVALFDGNMVQIPTQIITNGNGLFAVQAPAVAPNTTLFLRVASPSGAVGNYELNLNFGFVPVEQTTFVNATPPLAGQPMSFSLYVAQTQLLSLSLASQGNVNVKITDSLGNVVTQLTTQGGDISTGISKVLAPGKYRVVFTPATTAPFTLKGSIITNPIGPVVNSATLDPQYRSSTNPSIYTYPNGTTTSIPYLWLLNPV